MHGLISDSKDSVRSGCTSLHSCEISSWMLQYYHATHGSSHALNLFYINSLDQMQQSRGGPNKDTIYSTVVVLLLLLLLVQ